MSRRWVRTLAFVVALATVSLSTSACNRFGFTGHIEEIVPATVAGKYGPQVRVTAWVQARTTAPWNAYATLNGMVPAGAPGFATQEFSVPRPDVEAKHGGHARGIVLLFAPPPRGVYHLCLHVVPPSVPLPQAGEIPGEGSDVVECAWLIQGRDWTDRADIERISVSGGVVTVEGWVRSAYANFKHVDVLADGQYRQPVSSESGGRPDIDALYGEGTTSFRYTFPEDPSVSRWCISTYYWNGDPGMPLSSVKELDCASTTTP